MSVKTAKKTVKGILSLADVKINGDRDWDIQVHDDRFYQRVLADKSLGLGESYMDGWWNCDAIDELICNILIARLDEKVKITPKFARHVASAWVTNQQRKSRAHVIGEHHYDTGNDLFKLMLDTLMNYSCGYWKDAKNLDEAQEAKLELICQKLVLQKGMTVLDIGCGWGAFAEYAAKNYNVKVFGITVSEEQVKFASDRCKGLDVKIQNQDYRDLKDSFERVVSIGMFEHVGRKNYEKFFNVVNSVLKDDGIFLLHTIGGNKSVWHTDPWTHKYIFPNGMLPSEKQITKAYHKIFNLRDWHEFGADYDLTLMAWHKNFNKHWDEIKDIYEGRVNGKFKRMWDYYLLSSAGAFRAHKNRLWQIVLTKTNSQVAYQSVR